MRRHMSSIWEMWSWMRSLLATSMAIPSLSSACEDAKHGPREAGRRRSPRKHCGVICAREGGTSSEIQMRESEGGEDSGRAPGRPRGGNLTTKHLKENMFYIYYTVVCPSEWAGPQRRPSPSLKAAVTSGFMTFKQTSIKRNEGLERGLSRRTAGRPLVAEGQNCMRLVWRPLVAERRMCSRELQGPCTFLLE